VKKQQMQQNGLSSSADEVTALQNEGGMERSKIEELLRKYGFGSWTRPEEVWRGRNISRVSVIITTILLKKNGHMLPKGQR